MLAIIPGALPSQKFYLFFLLFVLVFFSYTYRNFRYVAVLRTEEITKKRNCAMPTLNILIYNKMIKQIVKLAVHIQKISGLNMLQFEINCVLSRIKHNS